VNTKKENCNKLKQNLDTVKNNVPLDTVKYKNPEKILKKFQELVEGLKADEKTLENLIQVAKAKNKYKEITESAKTLKQEIENEITTETQLGKPSVRFNESRQAKLKTTKEVKNENYEKIKTSLNEANQDYSKVLSEGVSEAKAETQNAFKELYDAVKKLADFKLDDIQVSSPAPTQKPPAKSKPKAKPK
jgi:hypothetical protein